MDSMFSEVWTSEIFLKRGRLMVHSVAIWNDVLEFGTAETIIKTRSLNGAFCRNMKQIIYTVKSIKMCPKTLLAGAPVPPPPVDPPLWYIWWHWLDVHLSMCVYISERRCVIPEELHRSWNYTFHNIKHVTFGFKTFSLTLMNDTRYKFDCSVHDGDLYVFRYHVLLVNTIGY